MAIKKENKFLKNKGTNDGYIGLNRAINLGDFPTAFAFASSIVITVVSIMVGMFFEKTFEDSAILGLILAATYFLTWLLSCELDPERKIGGLIGGFIAIGMYFVLGEGNPLVLVWLLFIVRMFNRTSGSMAKLGDNAIIIFMAYYLSRGGFWLYPVFTGLAYAAESQLKGGSFRNLYLAALCFGITAVTSDNLNMVVNLDLTYVVIMGITVILFLPAISMATYIKMRDDRNNFDLNSRRVQAGQAGFLFGSILIAWFHGNSQAISFMPAWGGAIGVGLYLFYMAIMKALKKA